MVPHVPECTHAHVREGDVHIAERVEKKTGTNWDRDQTGRVAVGERADEDGGDAVAAMRDGAPAKKKRISGHLQPLLAHHEKDPACTADKI